MNASQWQLKTDIFQSERREFALKAELSQAKFDVRNAKFALTEYESGGFRKFLDRLSGKQEDRLYSLRSESAKAEARLNALLQEKSAVEETLTEKRTALAALPDDLPDHRAEARFCITCLTAMLPEAGEALEAMRTMMQGAEPGRIISREEQQEVYGNADHQAEACAALFRQLEAALKTLDIPFEIPICYHNPTGYLASATQYTRRDRLNDLIAQTGKLHNRLPELLRQLGE